MSLPVPIDRFKRRLGRALQKLLQRPIVVDLPRQCTRPGAFLISAPRSGSTLVRMMLDSHPRIAAGPESHILVPLLSALKDERSLDAMWHRGFHRDAVVATLGEAARTFLEAYAASKGKDLWVEKTPRYVSILPELCEVFPAARFLLLYRHPFDVICSMDKRRMIENVPEIAPYRGRFESDLAVYCAYVANEQRAMQRFQEQHAARVLELRYEAIVADPQREMRRSCTFLGIEFVPDMCEYDRFAHDDGHGDPSIYRFRGVEPRVRTYGGWSPVERAQAAAWLREALEALGYAA